MKPENIVALHCLAGKGRAGMMACCLLLHTKKFATAVEAISHYDEVRMRKASKRGLTVPSQIRYVKYYQQLLELNERGLRNPVVDGSIKGLRLVKITLRDCPEQLAVHVYTQQGIIGNKTCTFKSKKPTSSLNLSLKIVGNTLIRLVNAKNKTVGSVWFNTAMHPGGQLVFEKMEIDKFHKDKGSILDTAAIILQVEEGKILGVTAPSLNRNRAREKMKKVRSDFELEMMVIKGARVARESLLADTKAMKAAINAAADAVNSNDHEAQIGNSGKDQTKFPRVVDKTPKTEAHASDVEVSLGTREIVESTTLKLDPGLPSSVSVHNLDPAATPGTREKEFFAKSKAKKEAEEKREQEEEQERIRNMTEDEKQKYLASKEDARRHEKNKDKMLSKQMAGYSKLKTGKKGKKKKKGRGRSKK